MILSRGKWAEISPDPADPLHVVAPQPAAPGSATGNRLTMDDLQRDHVRAILEGAHWRVEGSGGAAEILGMNPNTLRRRMRKLGIQRPGSRAVNDLC